MLLYMRLSEFKSMCVIYLSASLPLKFDKLKGELAELTDVSSDKSPKFDPVLAPFSDSADPTVPASTTVRESEIHGATQRV